MANLNGVQVFGSGTWIGSNKMPMKFTNDDLKLISETTGKLLSDNKIKPKLKLGHSTSQILKGQSDGDPSLGKASNFAIEGDKIITDFIDMPDIVHEAIKKGLYSDISAELDFSKELGSWYIKAVSLLGADLPAVKSLSDLKLYLSEIDSDDFTLNLSEPLIQTNKDDMSDQTKIAELELKLAQATAQTEMDKAKLVQFSEHKRSEEFESAKSSILKPYSEDVKQGILPPAILTKLEGELLVQKANFSDTLTVSPELTREISQSYTKLKVNETASDVPADSETKFSDPSDQVAIKVAETMATSQLSYSEASSIVFNSNPDLAKQYNEWSHNTMHEVN